MIIIDDMISSLDSMLEVAALLKEKKAGKIFMCSTFDSSQMVWRSLTKHMSRDCFDRLLTTNLVYQTPELLEKPYYVNCDMTQIYRSADRHHQSRCLHQQALDPVERIHRLMNRHCQN
jgi:ribose-phosphate pyrophosphokinase